MIKYSEGKYMINITENFEKIKSLYNKLVDNMINSYNIMGKNTSFKMEKREFIVSIDNYIQVVIIKTIMSERTITTEELSLVRSLVRYSDFLADLKFTKGAQLKLSTINQLNANIENYLNYPLEFAKLAIIIDKELEQVPINHEPTLSSYLYSCLVYLIKLVKEDIEEVGVRSILDSIISIFIENHISYL